MSWLGILLIGFAVTDLVHSARKVKVLPQMVGALSVLLLGMLGGLTSGRDVVALSIVAVVVLAWGFAVTWGFGHPAQTAAWLPLALFSLALTGAIVAPSSRRRRTGLIDRWLGAATSLPWRPCPPTACCSCWAPSDSSSPPATCSSGWC